MSGVERHLEMSPVYLDRLSLEDGSRVAGRPHSEAAAVVRGSSNEEVG